MAEERGTIEFAVGGQTISALTAGPPTCPGRPLIPPCTAGRTTRGISMSQARVTDRSWISPPASAIPC